MAKKLLIVGDSFSASTSEFSWTNKFDQWTVTNLSSNGASQYRLIKILKKELTQNAYDKIIFVHTSPNRIYVDNHPYHENTQEYKNCDLIYSDIYDHLPDEYAQHITWWFENIFDLEQSKFVHELMIDHIMEIIPDALHITFFDLEHPKIISLYKIWQTHKGTANHMDVGGNQRVFDFICQYI